MSRIPDDWTRVCKITGRDDGTTHVINLLTGEEFDVRPGEVYTLGVQGGGCLLPLLVPIVLALVLWL